MPARHGPRTGERTGDRRVGRPRPRRSPAPLGPEHPGVHLEHAGPRPGARQLRSGRGGRDAELGGGRPAVLVQAADTVGDSERMFAAAAEHAWVAGVVAWIPLDDPPRRAAAGPVGGDRATLRSPSAAPRSSRPRPPRRPGRTGDVGGGRGPRAAARHPRRLAAALAGDDPPGRRHARPHRRPRPPRKAPSASAPGRPAPTTRSAGGSTTCPARRASFGGGQAVGARRRTRPGVSPTSGRPPARGGRPRRSGRDRLMFGGDWPVSLGEIAYPDLVREVRASLRELAPADQGAILHGTARRAYGLAPAAAEAGAPLR